MIYRDFQGEKLSMLGFGTMRLPLIPGGKETDIDQEQVNEMVRLAFEGGVNYFDTAYPYHGSCSEIAIGKALADYPRESYNLADKYPGHQLTSKAKAQHPSIIFEDQLKKCGVEYFDYYLMHNVNEYSLQFYADKELGFVDYFVEQKKLGKIRHLGFSCHGTVENMREYLELYAEHMEFCQIQLNYLDWTLQDAEGKIKLLEEYNIPVWVMEPVRGGKLARLDEKTTEMLHSLRPEESTAAWCFRWLQTVPKPTMVLSGMSDIEQMKDNIKTFSEEKPLNEGEINTLYEIADVLRNSIPCTACRYCCEGCPKQLDIPSLLSLCNDSRVAESVNVVMRYGAIDEEKNASACIGCGKCVKACPQKINVPEAMKELSQRMEALPSWIEICKKREEAAKRSASN